MRRIERRAPDPGGKVCAFTGHRPSKYPFLAAPESEEYRRLWQLLRDKVGKAVRDGYTHFLCGGALGADTMAALLLIEERATNPLLTLEVVLPCPEQSKYWREKDARLHAEICEKADVLTCVSSAYTPFCMLERNRYMVESSTRLIAVYDGTPGGTFNTLKTALDKGIEIEIIDPRSLTKERL